MLWQYRNSEVGRYEGRFFNLALERLRRDYNSATRRVVFVATSDKPLWLRTHLHSEDDIHYPHRQIRQTRVALPSLKEISMMHAHQELAVKGDNINSYNMLNPNIYRSDVIRRGPRHPGPV